MFNSKNLIEERKKRIQFRNSIQEKDKAEFINGKVVQIVNFEKRHQDCIAGLLTTIDIFVNKSNLGYAGGSLLMVELSQNDFQPDICFFKKEKSDNFSEEQVLFPAPDLVVEVLSKGTAKNDRGVKFEDYEAHEVQEYWIVDPKNKVVEQYCLNEMKKYELKVKSGSGDIESEAITGFKIKIKAIFDKTENLKELNRLMNE